MKKFRVYDNKNKKYCDNNSDDSGLPHNQIYFEDGKGYFIIKPRNNRKLEQFTGLIDANGREVYEGDRVKIYQEFEKNEWRDISEGIIMYHHGQYWVVGDNDRLGDDVRRTSLSVFWVGGNHNKIEVL